MVREQVGGVVGSGLARKAAQLTLAASADRAVLWWRCWELWEGWGGEQLSLGGVPVLLPVVRVWLPPVVRVSLGGLESCLLGSPV